MKKHVVLFSPKKTRFSTIPDPGKPSRFATCHVRSGEPSRIEGVIFFYKKNHKEGKQKTSACSATNSALFAFELIICV